MEQKLVIYNTLNSREEVFEPLNAPHVGMYVCGPTVYGDAHLGHARPAITFDLLFRYLKHIGYKVRYVRNITDVGHLENDADEGEDKIAKKARLEQVEPMEVVQNYTNRYHKTMDALNVLPPSIEPQASGHIIEQIDIIKKILDKGYAYESNGSIYFDVKKYNKDYNYGILSHRNIEEMLNTTRELDGQDEKRSKVDFALWKKASLGHIMKWRPDFKIEDIQKYKNNLFKNSNSNKERIGYPGWHIECSAMSLKYLGNKFDIHGGGLDLMFPHHECEIAQNTVATGDRVVKYWMHNNMITIGGKKMGKSLGNFITLDEFFTGDHKLLTRAYSPMTIRFFILQSHYRSIVDFSDEMLQIAERKLAYLLESYERINKVKVGNNSDTFVRDAKKLEQLCYDALNDDLNTPLVISYLDEAASTANSLFYGNSRTTKEDLNKVKSLFDIFLFKILGIRNELNAGDKGTESYEKAIDLLLQIRADAKANKDWATSDKIRDELNKIGFEIKDGKDGSEWKLK